MEGKTLCIGAEPLAHAIEVDFMIGNAFMASTKYNEAWLCVLSEISNSIGMKYEDSEVLNTTGPLMITRLFNELKNKYNASLISSRLTAPVTKMDMYLYINNLDVSRLEEKIKEAYCAHYFFGSWEERSSFYKYQ